jgi:hypothetical protein
MSSVEFISQYISEIVTGGGKPVEAAKKEIQEIDEVLKKADVLKVRRMNLVSVLDHLGDETYKRRRISATPSSDDIDTTYSENKEIIKNIRSAISEYGPLLVKDLVRKVGGYDQDSLIMRAVKLLGDQEIVSRDKDGRVQPGKNWEKEI